MAKAARCALGDEVLTACVMRDGGVALSIATV